jgi:hypothetical protein
MFYYCIGIVSLYSNGNLKKISITPKIPNNQNKPNGKKIDLLPSPVPKTQSKWEQNKLLAYFLWQKLKVQGNAYINKNQKTIKWTAVSVGSGITIFIIYFFYRSVYVFREEKKVISYHKTELQKAIHSLTLANPAPQDSQ